MDPRLAMMFPAGGADVGLAGAAALPPGMMGGNVGAMSLFGLGVDPGVANVVQFLAPTEQRYQTATLLMQMIGSSNYGPTATSLPILYASGFEGVPLLGSSSSPGILSSLVSMFGAPAVQAVARQHKLIPMGMGHDLNIYDLMLRSQASADRLEKLLTAQRLDVVGYMEAVRGLANLAGVPFGLEQQLAVRNLITNIQPYLPMLSMLAPDLVDQLSGRRGSISSLGLKLIGAGRYRIDPITGRLGLSPETVATYIESIFDELLSDPTLRRSKGLSAGQLGALFEQLQLRGMLPSIVSSSYEQQTPYKKLERVLNELVPMQQADVLNLIHKIGRHREIKDFNKIDFRENIYTMSVDEMKKYIEDIKEILQTLREDVLESLIDLPEINTALARLDAKAIIRKLEGYAGAVNAVKEVFAEAGFRNVPVEVAMRGIEVFTLGQAQKYTPEQIENMIRSTRNIANLTGTTIDNFILMQNHTAAVLRQANVPTTLANPITQQALLQTANARGLGVLSVPSVYTPTDQQLTQSAINSAAYFAASPIARIGAVALRLKQMGLVPEDDEKNELARFVKQIERGVISEEFLSKGESGLIAMLQRNIIRPQENAATVFRLLGDQIGNSPYVERLLPLSRHAQRTEILNRMTNSLMTETQLKAIVNQQIQNEIERGPLQGKTEQEVEKRRNELLQVLSRRLSETLLDEMSVQDFADERKRQEVIKKVIADTLKIEPSKVDDALVAGLVGGAIPNLDRVISNMSGGSLQNLYTARAIVGRPAIHGALGLQAVIDTRTEIQQRLQHLGSSDSIIANIMTTLQAAKPTDRLNLVSLLIRSIGTQSAEEIVDNMLPVVEKLTDDLRKLENMEKKINDPAEFNRMSDQERSTLLKNYESLKQGILQSINEIDTISKRHGLDVPMRRGPSVQDTELRLLQSTMDQLIFTNLGYTLIDPELAAKVAKSPYSHLGQYMPLSYIADQNRLDMNRPAPFVSIGGFEQLTRDKMRYLMRRDTSGEGKLLGQRSKFVTAGLGGILGMQSSKSDTTSPYDQKTALDRMKVLERMISTVSQQGLEGISNQEERENMVRRIASAVYAVGNLFGTWMSVDELADPKREGELLARIRQDLQSPDSRSDLMNFLQVVVETAYKANNPNYVLTDQDINRLLASAISVGYIIPKDFIQALRKGGTNLTVENLQRFLQPEHPLSFNASKENERIFDWYKYSPRTGIEIRPFITAKDLGEQKFKESEVYAANRFLASLYLSASSNNNLPAIESVRNDPRFTAITQGLQEFVIKKYQEIYKLDPNLRRRMLADLGRNANLIRADDNEAAANLIALATYSRLVSGQDRFDPAELKNKLISEGIFRPDELETGGDLYREEQVNNLLFTIHRLNQLNFNTFSYIKDNYERIRSETKKDRLDAATLNIYLQDEVLRPLIKLMEPEKATLGNINADLVNQSLERIVKEAGGGQAITSMLNRIADDIYNTRSRLLGPGGRGNISLEKQILFTGITDKLRKYSEIIGKYGGNLDQALRELDSKGQRDLFQTISQIFSLYRRVINFELEKGMPGMLTVDAGEFLRSPVLDYDPIKDKKGDLLRPQALTTEHIRATKSALQHFVPEEARRAAMEGDIGIAQSFTILARHFGLPIDPGVDLEQQLTERQKVALVLMTEGANRKTLEKLREKLPQPQDVYVDALLNETRPEKQTEAAKELIRQFILDTAERLGVSNLNPEYIDRIIEDSLGGPGAVRTDYLLFGIPFTTAADRSSEGGSFAVSQLPRVSAEQSFKAFNYAHYQSNLAPHVRPILQKLFEERGINLGNDPEILDTVYQILIEKENTRPSQQVAASTAVATPFGFGASGLVLAPNQVELANRWKHLRHKLSQTNLKPQQIDEIFRIAQDIDLSDELNKRTVVINRAEALQKLVSPDRIGLKPQFQNLASNVKAEHALRIERLIEERDKLIKDFSAALQRSSVMTDDQFKQLSRMHPYEQVRKLIEVAKTQGGDDPTIKNFSGKAEDLLQRIGDLIRELSPTGGQRPSLPERAPSQGGQQGPREGRVLPSTLPGQGPGGQLGQNTTSPQQLVAAAEPRDMNINGKLIIEGLFGVPLVGRLSGKGQSSVPSRHPVSS